MEGLLFFVLLKVAICIDWDLDAIEASVYDALGSAFFVASFYYTPHVSNQICLLVNHISWDEITKILKHVHSCQRQLQKEIQQRLSLNILDWVLIDENNHKIDDLLEVCALINAKDTNGRWMGLWLLLSMD